MCPTPGELELFAGQEEVEIMPRFDSPVMWLIGGDLGPFKAGIPTKVPLWIALHLRAQNKCKIVPLPWLNKAYLEQLKDIEIKSALFTKMPSEHYMAVTRMIFEVCPQDIPEADDVKLLIKDIWDSRMSKLRTAVRTFIDKGASWAKVDNLTQLEMCSIRPFFTHSLEQLHRFRKTIQVARLYAAGNSSEDVRRRLRM
ncbi:DNA replication complex GINS protein PSF2 [Orchesella cincta]|uniref:DNA replication complex GINS protein PSF2 n=1 Tax=Orchesella cincta TaxID=48709 RepID=A0A1D2M6U4_ORCCI|nr:DNA replication complex GINS protein PSF2 [Orchesella cincta]